VSLLNLQMIWDCLHPSEKKCLQNVLDRFLAACDQAEMKISTKNTAVLCFFRNPGQGHTRYDNWHYTATSAEVQVL